ncbi:major facilitator superfamily transporter [Xylariaceae sp. FL0804]|nr:major facilitator superfamily transporter [Xylariaceae sp. FL0804]
MTPVLSRCRSQVTFNADNSNPTMAGPAKLDPPPNFNKVRSWLAVFGASLALFCTVGYFNAFGVYQDYYLTYLPGESAFDISWIGSVSIFLLYIGGPVAGVLVDRFGPTVLLCTGSLLQLLAVFLSSLCTRYWQLFLAQAVLLGVAMSLILTPSIAVVSRRMPHRRGLALGITVGTSSIGGVVWPIVINQLLYRDDVGFGWTQRAVGFVMLPLFAIACLTVQDAPVQKGPQQPPSETSGDSEEKDKSASETKQKKKTDLSILKNKTFLLLCLGLALNYLGLFTPFFYVSTYGISIGLSSSTAFYMISAINASSFFGRVLTGHLGDMYGHYNLCALSVFSAGIIGFTWSATHNLAGLVIWSLAYGFASGAVISLQSACAGKVAKREAQGTAMGLLTGSVSLTALVGTPISGQILSHGGYLGLGLWTGSTLLAGALVLFAARLSLSRKILEAH